MTSSSETSRLSGRPAWAFDRRIFLNGMRDGVPIALGYFAVSFSLGIAARNAGLTPLQGFFASLLNNASAGEYAAFTLIAANATLFQVALITLIANARYLLMSCALAQRFAPGTPFFHRLIIAYDVTDELFGITISRPGCLNPFYTYGAILLAAPAWAFGTAFGIMAGNALPLRAVSALSVALYGMFLAIIIPPARKNKVVAVLIVISFALSFFGSYVPGISALSDGTRTILLTVLISAAAAIFFPFKNTQEESEHVSKCALYRRHGAGFLYDPRPSADADPQTDPQHIYPVVSLLCALCYARCDDLSSHPARNAVADFRRSCPDRRNHRRMARRRIISGIRDLLRTGFPDRAVYLKKLISQLKFLALSSVTNLLCCSYDTDQSEIPHNFSSGRRVIVNGRF